MNKRLGGSFALVVMLACAPAAAQTYKCTDARGVTAYSDKPCAGAKGGEVRIPGTQPQVEKAKPKPKPSYSAPDQPQQPERTLTINEQAEKQLAARLA